MRFLLFGLSIFICITTRAQNLHFVKSTLAHLTDSSFYGRGYINNGTQLAADYIDQVFDSLQVSKLGRGRQAFAMRVNTFPGQMILACDDDTLVAGHDFIVSPKARSIQGSFKVTRLDSTDFQSEKTPRPKLNKAPMINMAGIRSPDARGFLHDYTLAVGSLVPIIRVQPKKLTWSVAQEQSDQTVIDILDHAVCRKAKTITVNIEAVEKEVELENIIRIIPGKRSDSTLVFTAHYDHIGMMGPALFPGASDNATGTSMLLDLAAYYAKNQPKFDMVFIAFAAEEAGLVGSKFYVDNPLFPLEKIQLLINLDLMGSASKGISIVNGLLYPERMKIMSEINDEYQFVPRINHGGKSANSDHYWFSEAGVPAIFIFTIGEITAYHDVNDRADGIDWTNYHEVFTLLVKFIDKR